MQRLTVIGSTGSIGRQTLEVVESFPELFKVVGLSAQSNVELLARQVRRYHPEAIALGDEAKLPALRQLLPDWAGEILVGPQGFEELASRDNYQTLVSAAVGAAGIRPTLTAIETGHDVALANKETLVAAGHLIMKAVKACGVRLRSVDSEHSAIFQCLEGKTKKGIARLILTASGGPFRSLDPAALAKVTPEEALKHPTWNMGGKITIDSATLMNKGLEVIEAHWLFEIDYSAIDVVIHPQSAIHSMVEYADGSIMAQLGPADMRLPIQYALVYPERLPNNFHRLDFFQLGRMDFAPPDTRRFPALALAYEAGKAGGTMPAVMNAANELAVAAFLARRIGFTDIPRMVELAMGHHQNEGIITEPTLDEVLAADGWVRSQFESWLRGIGR